MRKLIITATLLGAMFSAKAQTIKVMTQCGEKTRIVNFTKVDAYSNVISHHSVGSQCVKQEFPPFKIEVGNYEFENLNIPDGEDWFCEIRRNGKVTRKGRLTLNHFETIMTEDMSILIIIAPKLKCNCE